MNRFRLLLLSMASSMAMLAQSVSTDSIGIRRSDFQIDYSAEVTAAVGGDFAPYYIASNRHGVLSQGSDLLLRATVGHQLDLSRRLSFGFGVDLVGGYASSTDYLRFSQADDALIDVGRRPSAFFIQQLYGVMKYRQAFVEIGARQHESALLNFSLSSGDLVESGNARPIPQLRIGFLDFVDIPLTNGWVQINGIISYGKFLDNGWMKDHYNYYNWHINLGGLYTYKRCYFRTKPSMPLSVTLGMQTAGLFGGTTSYYSHGQLTRTLVSSRSIKTFFKMFLPIRGQGSEYYEGNSLGSWDVMARYRFASGAQIKAYVQKPFEDGSGIGWLNGFDGLWGVEYKSADPSAIVSGAVIEYLDFTNQSGPIHWAPGDIPGTTLQSHADGGDMYYNNYLSNAYMNYGMSIGTPFLPAPIYNTDGYMAYVHNRIRGFHCAVTGNISPSVAYRAMAGYRKGWGDGRIPVAHAATDFSAMVEASWRMPWLDGLTATVQLAIDRGSLLGDRAGGALSLTYQGLLAL